MSQLNWSFSDRGSFKRLHITSRSDGFQMVGPKQMVFQQFAKLFWARRQSFQGIQAVSPRPALLARPTGSRKLQIELVG